MYTSKTWSNVLNLPIAVDFKVDFDWSWRVDDNKGVPVHFEDVWTVGQACAGFLEFNFPEAINVEGATKCTNNLICISFADCAEEVSVLFQLGGPACNFDGNVLHHSENPDVEYR